MPKLSKWQLISDVNNYLQTDYISIQDFADGCAYLLLLDSFVTSKGQKMKLSQCDWNPKKESDRERNIKSFFRQCNHHHLSVPLDIKLDDLVQGKRVAHYDCLSWIWDILLSQGPPNYDALKVRYLASRASGGKFELNSNLLPPDPRIQEKLNSSKFLSELTASSPSNKAYGSEESSIDEISFEKENENEIEEETISTPLLTIPKSFEDDLKKMGESKSPNFLNSQNSKAFQSPFSPYIDGLAAEDLKNLLSDLKTELFLMSEASRKRTEDIQRIQAERDFYFDKLQSLELVASEIAPDLPGADIIREILEEIPLGFNNIKESNNNESFEEDSYF
eukprot:TRINITY_DN538_c0_g1_i1.p1 TRINITY_DN538_c0_g1~~TRINITY_DN538_c0_g1_i1.p1  ORF type:complete len:335 (+),score=111.39 TRINITY_DN538_c0_g1_i1:1125-2129(+)